MNIDRIGFDGKAVVILGAGATRGAEFVLILTKWAKKWFASCLPLLRRKLEPPTASRASGRRESKPLSTFRKFARFRRKLAAKRATG